MGDSFLHYHCCDLQPVFFLAQISDQVDLVGRPLVFKNGDFGFQFDLEGVKLPYLQEIVFFGVSSLDGDT